MRTLSPEHPSFVEAYLQQGFVAPVQVIDDHDIEEWTSRVNDVLTRPGLAPPPPAADAEGRLGALTGGPSSIPFVESRHLDEPVIYALCTAEPVLAACRAILGNDLLLWRSTLIQKSPGGPGFAWHQDFGGVFDAGSPYGLEPPLHVNVWLALTTTTRSNGCLRFIPGAHHLLPSQPSGPGRHATLLTDAKYVDEEAATDVPLAAGQAVLFSDRALHASWPNRGDDFRTALAIRITLPQVRVRSHFSGHGNLLISGDDALGVNMLSSPPI